MAKKKNGNNQNQSEQSILQEAGLPEGSWQVLDSNPLNPAQPRPGAEPPSPNEMPPHFVGTLNPDMQHDKVFVGTQLASPRIASTPLMPVGPAGNPQQNAAIRSIIKINQAAAATSTSGTISFLGPWLSFVTYNIGNIVTYNNSSYVAITSSIGAIPWSNPANWTLLGKNLNFRGIWAAIQTVRQNAPVVYTINGTPTSTTFGLNVLAGSHIVVNTFAKNIGASAVPVVSDSQGNIYTLVVAGGRIDSNEYQMQTWISKATTTAGPLTVNVTWTGGTTPGTGGILATEITGLMPSPVGASTHAEEKVGGALPMTLTVAAGQMLYTSATVDNSPIIAPFGFSSFTDGSNDTSSAWNTTPPVGSNTVTWVSTVTRFMATAVALSLSQTTFNYNPYDVVEFNGSMWIAVAATNGNPISDPTSWVLFAQSVGLAQVKTASYLAVSGDEGTLLSFNGSAITLTLPSTPPDSGWWIAVQNIGSTAMSISPNGLTIDGSSSSMSIPASIGLLIFTDGTNYFTQHGIGLVVENANAVYSGPASGPPALPGFRALVYKDLQLAGSVNAQTSSYLAVGGDNGKLITFSSSSAVTLTLPATPPSSNWWIAVQDVGSGALTVSPNGLNLDGSVGSLSVPTNQGVLIYTDGTNYFTERGLSPASTVSAGGVNAQTVSYTAVSGDNGKLISMNGTSLTLTLPATPPSTSWWIAVEDVNATSLTISRNGLLIDGSATNLSLTQNQGVLIYTDGSNYFTSRGMGSGGGGGGAPSTDTYVLGTQDFANLPNSVANPTAYYGPDVQPTTAGSLDDEFNGSTLNTSTRWTWVNQGPATATVNDSVVQFAALGTSSINLRYIYQTAPATPWEVTAKIGMFVPAPGSGASFSNNGLCLSDSSGKVIVFGPFYSTGYGMGEILNYNSPTSFNGSSLGGFNGANGTNFFFRIRDNGTNLIYSISPDGAVFTQVASISRTAFLTSGPTRVGLLVEGSETNSTSTTYISVDWFRRTL